MSNNSAYYQTLFATLVSRHYAVTAHAWQSRVGGLILHQSSLGKQIRLLCVQGTGMGKLILYQTLSAHYKGVTIYISPLLTLGADQLNKLMAKTRVFASTVTPIYYLDTAANGKQVAEIISAIMGMREKTSMLLCLPLCSRRWQLNTKPSFGISVRRSVSLLLIKFICSMHLGDLLGRNFDL